LIYFQKQMTILVLLIYSHGKPTMGGKQASWSNSCH
jgi:hypothetical protein